MKKRKIRPETHKKQATTATKTTAPGRTTDTPASDTPKDISEPRLSPEESMACMAYIGNCIHSIGWKVCADDSLVSLRRDADPDLTAFLNTITYEDSHAPCDPTVVIPLRYDKGMAPDDLIRQIDNDRGYAIIEAESFTEELDDMRTGIVGDMPGDYDFFIKVTETICNWKISQISALQLEAAESYNTFLNEHGYPVTDEFNYY